MCLLKISDLETSPLCFFTVLANKAFSLNKLSPCRGKLRQFYRRLRRGGVEGLDLDLEIDDEVVFLGELGLEERNFRFEGGDACRERDGGDFAHHIEDIIRKVEVHSRHVLDGFSILVNEEEQGYAVLAEVHDVDQRRENVLAKLVVH
ncbi:hypothetical protein U1Q18_049102 [Sarracenia purpurea var. burkii]